MATFFKVFLSADMPNLVEGVWTKLTWDSPWYDSRGWFDFVDHRYVVGEEGLYCFSANLEFATIPLGGMCDIALWVNGGTGPNSQQHTQFQSAKSYEFVSAPIVQIYYLYPGDYVEVYGKHANTGASKIISTSHEETVFSGFKIS